MYLNKKTYVGAHYEHRKTKVEMKITKTTAEKDGTTTVCEVAHIDPQRIGEITERVGYWRKANQIHAWFVHNVQGGRDECQESEVSREQLGELLDLCRKVKEAAVFEDGKIHTSTNFVSGAVVKHFEDGKVLTDESRERITELLPPMSGPFFGSTDYDEYYMQDIDHTIVVLEALNLGDEDYDVTYTYQASW